MLSYIELRNFKSFSHIKLDLRGIHGIPKKSAFIYGENGSGKSNLILSFLFLSRTFDTLQNQERIRDLRESDDRTIENIKREELTQDILESFIKLRFNSLSELISEYKSIDSNGFMSVSLGFYLNKKNGIYTIEFNDQKVIKEELKFQINERMGNVFKISEDKVSLSPGIFNNIEYRNELIIEIEKYWGKHTFMAILFNEIESKNEKYFDSRVNSNLFTVIDWLNSCSISCNYNKGHTAKIAIKYKFLRQLDRGTIKDKKDKELLVFEEALNTFFTQLYSDIKSVKYVISSSEIGYTYELYFKKLIENKIIDVPISLESTGTQKLLEIFPMIFSSVIGKTVFIDEIDSGIHDLLMCNLIDFLEDSLKGQFIATTHNTLLMRQLSPENVYIICSDAYGNKSIVNILEYEFRTHKNNNIQNKYLQGDYEGVPFIGHLDLEEMAEDIIDSLSVEKLDS